jgi:lipoate synthase
LEHVQRLATVLHVVKDDLDDGGAALLANCVVVYEGVSQALLVTQPVRQGRERRVETLVPLDQRRYRAVVSRSVPCPTSNG